MLLMFFSILKIASPEGKHFSHLLKSWEDGFEKSACPNLIFTKRTSFSCPPPLHIRGIFSVLESCGWFPRPQGGFRSPCRHRCIFYWNEKQLNKATLLADLDPCSASPLISVMCSKNFCPFIYLFLVTLNSF